MALSDIEYNYWLTAEYDWSDDNSPDSETGSEITWCVSIAPMDDCEEIEEFANHKIVPPEGSTYKLMPGQTWKYTIRPWDGHNMFGNKAVGWKKTSAEIAIPIHCEVTDWIGGVQSEDPEEAGWSPCHDFFDQDISCGEGEQTRRREIVIQSALGGDECPEDILVENRPCNGPPCPTDCIPKPWSTVKWGPCFKDGEEVLCKGVTGTRTKTREVSVAATNGGLCEDLTRQESCEGTLDCCERCTPETDPIVAMHDKGWIESWGQWGSSAFGRGDSSPTQRIFSPFAGEGGRQTDINDNWEFCEEAYTYPSYNASGATSSLPYARHWPDYTSCGQDTAECGSKTIGGTGFIGMSWIHGYENSSQTSADSSYGCTHYGTPLEYDIVYNFDRPVNISRMEIGIDVQHNMGMTASSIPPLSSTLKQMKWRILGDMAPVDGVYPDGRLNTQSGKYNIKGEGSVENQSASSIGWYGGGNRSVQLANGSGPEVLNLIASPGDSMMVNLKGSRVWGTTGVRDDYWNDLGSYYDLYSTDTLPSDFRKSWAPLKNANKPTWFDKPQWGNVYRWDQFQGYAPGNTPYNVPWHVNRITIKFYWDAQIEDAWLVGVDKFKVWGIESCADGDAFNEFPTRCSKDRNRRTKVNCVHDGYSDWTECDGKWHWDDNVPNPLDQGKPYHKYLEVEECTGTHTKELRVTQEEEDGGSCPPRTVTESCTPLPLDFGFQYTGLSAYLSWAQAAGSVSDVNNPGIPEYEPYGSGAIRLVPDVSGSSSHNWSDPNTPWFASTNKCVTYSLVSGEGSDDNDWFFLDNCDNVTTGMEWANARKLKCWLLSMNTRPGCDEGCPDWKTHSGAGRTGYPEHKDKPILKYSEKKELRIRVRATVPGGEFIERAFVFPVIDIPDQRPW